MLVYMIRFSGLEGFLNDFPFSSLMTLRSVLPRMEIALFSCSQLSTWLGKGAYTVESPQLMIQSNFFGGSFFATAVRAG